MLANSILLLVSDRIGDVIFCTPAICLLRKAYPESEIAVIAMSKLGAEVLSNNPALDNIWVSPGKKFTRKLGRKYQLIIDLHDSRLTKKYVKWLNRPVQISPRSGKGHQSQVAVQYIQSLLQNDYVVDSEYQLFPTQKHFDKASALLSKIKKDRILIGCHMGSNASTRSRWWRKVPARKCWEVENYAQLMKELHQFENRLTFVLTGTPSEKILAEQLLRSFEQTINLVGQTSVLDLAALMKSFALFITGDTGPMHIAVAAQIPVIALFGPTKPHITGPYPLQKYHTLLQAKTMKDISVGEVVDAVKKHFSTASSLQN